MEVRTREHSPKENGNISGLSIWLQKESTFFWIMGFFLLFISALSFKTDGLSSIIFLFCAIIIFIVQNKNPLIIQYKELQDSDISSNIKHHQLYYPDAGLEKKLFQQSLFKKEYRDLLINSLLKISLVTLLLSFGILILFLLLVGDPLKGTTVISAFHIYTALILISLILFAGIFFMYKKYKLIKKEVYCEKNNYYFLVYKKRKYYYEVSENENGGNDYIIY